MPDTLYGIIGNDDRAVEKDIYRALAIKLYLDEKMSIGKASEIAGMNRVDFETYLSERQIPISLLTYEDVMQDVQKMRDV
jgi:predicted HTH domain antitoxin